jgi:hypothetical protein
VVGDGDVFPVGHEGVFGASEHGAYVEGVLFGGVEVGVVAYVDGHEHLCLAHGDEDLLVVVFFVFEVGEVGAEEFGDSFAEAEGVAFAVGDEWVEGGVLEVFLFEGEVFEVAEDVECVEVYDVVADGDSGSGWCFVGFEDAEREVLDGEIAICGDFYP